MELTKTISGRLRDLRKERGLSQFQVSQVLQIDRSTIAKYETAAAAPSVFILVNLAKMYEVSSDYILGLVSD